MLPFLKKPNRSTAIVDQVRPSDFDPKKKEENQILRMCAEELISAIHAKDSERVKEVLKAAFELMDSLPHEEGPHTEGTSFDELNQKAAREE